jgi:hypothetical protein
MVALGAATMVAALPAVPASGAEALPATLPDDPAAAAPPDDPAGSGAPGTELPRTVTGHDGFVVLGLALVATSVVALVTAVRSRPSQRRRRRRPHEMW